MSWARAILAANAHYLDGVIVPMPCPAEYNFYFTHDVLLTNLAAVNFDPERVRQDLLYIMSLSEGNVIPHAYYWRDDGYKTEVCTPDDWNHLWFILLNGSYLRHTADTVDSFAPLSAGHQIAHGNSATAQTRRSDVRFQAGLVGYWPQRRSTGIHHDPHDPRLARV